MLPDTGESTMSAPRARTFSTVSRLTTGPTVLMSMTVLPAPSPATKPSGPSATPSSAAESVTITKMTSAACATSRGVSPHFMPFIEEPLRFRFGAVVTDDRVALAEQAIDHPAAHRSEADVSEVCHNAGRSPGHGQPESDQ